MNPYPNIITYEIFQSWTKFSESNLKSDEILINYVFHKSQEYTGGWATPVTLEYISTHDF